MKRKVALLLFFFASRLLFSVTEEAAEEFYRVNPEQAATLHLSQEELVGGVISPLSGNLSLRQTDLLVKGAQPIHLTRTYLAPFMPCFFPSQGKNQKQWDQYFLYKHLASRYKGWQFYPHLKLIFYPWKREALVTDPSGMALSFYFTDRTYTKTELKGPPYGLSNFSGTGPSAKNDPRNTRILHNPKKGRFTVYSPDGSVRYYRKEKNRSASSILYLLDKETLPSGKVLRYRYKKGQPSYVESLDPSERFVYASIRIQVLRSTPFPTILRSAVKKGEQLLPQGAMGQRPSTTFPKPSSLRASNFLTRKEALERASASRGISITFYRQ